MNGTAQKIEIFKPFEEAFELMKKILFQPFDIKKWFVIGFAAFLANLSGGLHLNFPTNWNRKSWRPFDARDWDSAVDQLPHWVREPIIIGIVVVLFIALILIFSWLGARGRFIFADCIVKNRGAIVAPWHEFRKEANSYFLFSLLIGLIFIFITAVVALAILVPLFTYWKHLSDLAGVVAISSIVFLGVIVVVFALAWVLVSHFMLPVMYRQRCRAFEAFKGVAALIAAYPGEIVLYCLFLIVLVIGMAITSCVVICVTCCIAAIPYIGTVILLPIFVLLRAFSFCFLRQFGAEYDVWQEVAAITSPPPIPPPSQV